MIFNSFWKKIFILNIVLLLVIYRIFNVIEKYLNKNKNYNSLFPIISEDGYPFFNSINCDINSLISISKQILSNKNSPSIELPTNKLFSKECSFINKYFICINNKECLNKINQKNSQNYIYPFSIESLNYLYHTELNDFKIKDVLGISSLINLINNKNEFIDNKNNKNKIEIPFYHKIFSGYYSFLSVKQYDNNIKKNIHIGDNDYYNYNILKQITQYENKMNDLFYLHSLILYSYIKINKKNINENTTEFENLNIYLNYANQCIELSDDKFDYIKNFIIPKNLKNFEKIFLKEIMNIIDCIPDIYERSSFMIDMTAFNAMIKIIIEENDISDFEKDSLKYFLIEISKRINDIFNAEIELKNKVNLLKQNYIYIFIIFGCLSLAAIFLINRHLIKNKNKRNKKEITNKQRYNNFVGKNSNGNNINNNNNKKQLSQEELEYIQKLAKEHKRDFVIAK